MGLSMQRKTRVLSMILGLLCLLEFVVDGVKQPTGAFSNGNYVDQMRKMEAFKTSLTRHDVHSSSSPASLQPLDLAREMSNNVKASQSHMFLVTNFGADPSGKLDSTEAILNTISYAVNSTKQGSFLINGINDLGGAHISLEGGKYLIRSPIRFPSAGVGNVVIGGGTLLASDDFPENEFIIDLHATNASSLSYNYEYITLKDLLLDGNYRSGGISVNNSLRINIDNCYIAHFSNNGIVVEAGHETYIRNSFIGQHITAGDDPGERNYSGIGVSLNGNDNAVIDTIIFSAAIGIDVTGQANTFSGVHCYNKATFFGGVGIYIRLPLLTQIRIVNCYLDFVGIIAEDPVQLVISNSFFLGDAYVLLKSIHGSIRGVNIVDNMFAGSNKGIDIVQLDQSNRPFTQIDEVVVDRNNALGMNIRATAAKAHAKGDGTIWAFDFRPRLLFPNLISHVQHSFVAAGISFPNHALRIVADNQVIIESNEAVPGAGVYVSVDQESGD